MYKLLVNIVCLFSKRARKIRRLALGFGAGYKKTWRMIYYA